MNLGRAWTLLVLLLVACGGGVPHPGVAKLCQAGSILVYWNSSLFGSGLVCELKEANMIILQMEKDRLATEKKEADQQGKN